MFMSHFALQYIVLLRHWVLGIWNRDISPWEPLALASRENYSPSQQFELAENIF